MTPQQIRQRRLELDLTISELAFALDVDENLLERIEAGQSDFCERQEFEDAFARLEERVFSIDCVCAP